MTGFSGTPQMVTVNDKERAKEVACAKQAAADAAAAPRTSVQVEADKMSARVAKDRASALKIYRDHVSALALDKALTAKQSDELQSVAEILGVSAAEMTADVNAIKAHALHAKAIATTSLEVAELEKASKGWQAEREALNKRLREIDGSSMRLVSLSMGIGSSRNELDRLAQHHPRVIGDGAAIINPPDAKA